MSKEVDCSKRRFLSIFSGGTLWGGSSKWENASEGTPRANVIWRFDSDDCREYRLYNIVDGVAYVGTECGIFYSLSARDGVPIWNFQARAGGRIKLSAITEQIIYIEQGGKIYAVDRTSGSLRWQVDKPRLAAATDKTAYVTDENIYAIKNDGTERWRSEITGSPSQVVVYGDIAVVGSDTKYLYGIDTHDGTIRYRLESETGPMRPRLPTTDQNNRNPPLPQKDVLVIEEESEEKLYGISPIDGGINWELHSKDGKLFFGRDSVYEFDESGITAFSTLTGDKQWHQTLPEKLTWPRISDSNIYVGGVGVLYALSKDDGIIQWSTSLDTAAVFPGITDGGLLPIYDSDGRIWGIDAGDGSVKWTFLSDASSLWYICSSDERVYVSNRTGDVFALSYSDSTALDNLPRTIDPKMGSVIGVLLGGTLGAWAYRRLRRERSLKTDTNCFADLELVTLMDKTPYAEIYRARLADESHVALHRYDEPSDVFVDALDTWLQLDIPGVLDVWSWGTDPEPWVTTQIPDTTLAECANGLALEETINTVADAAETVHRAHREGVTHGRLAPESVWFVGDEVRVGDWGLAREWSVPEWLAPPEDGPDLETADAYQLAALASRLLPEERANEELKAVLSRALADDPDDRYDSALKFADTLRWAVRK